MNLEGKKAHYFLLSFHILYRDLTDHVLNSDPHNLNATKMIQGLCLYQLSRARLLGEAAEGRTLGDGLLCLLGV